LPRQYGRAASFGSTRAAQLVRVSVAGTWPAFPGGWPVRRGVVAVGLRWCRPRGVGNVERVCRWRNGRRAQRAWHSIVGSCVCGPLPPACVHSTSRPTRPSSVTACGVRIGAILLVLGAASAAYGQLVGPLKLSPVYIMSTSHKAIVKYIVIALA
jgi:hypothetical protein